jgi:hypothetical protein
MFSRIQNAIRTITYREPETGQDAAIVEHKTPTATGAGKVISHTLELLLVVYVLAYMAGYISDHLTKVIPATRSVSIEVVAGAIGAVLVLILHQLRNDIQEKIKARINLSELLAPYFGHRLDYTIRVLKG